ncbi:PLP-dependent cysteine synthase family protein [Herbidospora yilanensis]|uniref:PLP-dependent cysteine synthase family protein n=1 Tax=Herbidospora yilanensis TaxID=354426 RepID=UPI0007844C7B|nr:PLP-dependent cysteine synthase family protein [Herbidospora yilanensis]
MKHVDRHDPATRTWVNDAIRAVEADANRSCDTHLHVFPLPPSWGVDLYLKDESVHPTGSLKHRLARSLFLYGLSNGWIGPNTTIIEASSGSTAVSEAYFARLLGLPFIAVIPATTSPEKREIIEFYGGKCHLVDDPGKIYEESARLALETGGHYMDQFTYAERATDWRGNNNIAESIYEQMAMERFPVPAWIVVGAGTGGTSATIGRYIRYRRHSTRLCVADPEGSSFYPSWVTGAAHPGTPSRIEGIGRPRVEPSFLPMVIDRMTSVPDATSIAAMRWVNEVTHHQVGASTGTSVAAAMEIIREMRSHGIRGSVVTLICDSSSRYKGTYEKDSWLRKNGIDIAPALAEFRSLFRR